MRNPPQKKFYLLFREVRRISEIHHSGITPTQSTQGPSPMTTDPITPRSGTTETAESSAKIRPTGRHIVWTTESRMGWKE